MIIVKVFKTIVYGTDDFLYKKLSIITPLRRHRWEIQGKILQKLLDEQHQKHLIQNN